MNFVGYDYRKERKGADDDGDSLPENSDDENDGDTS